MSKTARILATTVVCLAAIGMFALFGCSSSDSSGAESQDVQQPAAQSEEAADAAQPQEEEATGAEAKYTVTVDDAYVGADYEGNPVIIVTYSWANNSDEATSALASLEEKAFQNGVELEDAFIVDGMDTSGWDSEVKPGSGTTFQRGYVLADTSEVSIEVTDLWDWENDGLLAEATFSVE